MATKRAVVLVARPTKPTSATAGAPLPPKGGGGGPTNRSGLTTVESILEAARRLSAEDRQKLLALLAADREAEGNADPDQALWFEALLSAFERAHVPLAGAGGPRQCIRANFGPVKAWGPVKLLIQHVGFDKMSRAERLSGFQLIAGLLLVHSREVCAHVGAPVTAKTVSNHVGNIEAIFDSQFPGYLAAGLGGLPFRQRSRDHSV